MRTSALWLVLLSVTACDCGEPPAGACMTTDECDAARVCIDGLCVPRGVDDGGVDMTADTTMTCTEGGIPCDGTCCEAGERCDGTSCCAADVLCGGVCCGGDDEACVADSCVPVCEGGDPPCGSGDDAACCAGEDVCYLGACTAPGDTCESSIDCPEGEYCEVIIGRCLPRAMGEECEYRPELAEFTLTEKWSWLEDSEVLPAHRQVMMAPMVANLNDDNGDGLVDRNDIPDVVFHTFAGSNYISDGVLRAISGDDGHRLWPTEDPTYRTTAGGEIAIAELVVESGGPEIVACSSTVSGTAGGFMMIIAANGAPLRLFDTAPNDVPCVYHAAAIADMDSDGVPEIVMANAIAHADGTVVHRHTGMALYPAISDMDDDGQLEVVNGNAVVEMDGTVVWSAPGVTNGHPAIADLDLDGTPEIVNVAAGPHAVWALNGQTGEIVWGPVDINPDDPIVTAAIAETGNPGGGGPPTIANFDDDPEPEIAFAGGYAYSVFEPTGTEKWHYITQDRSSRQTGSSVFDFEGDGIAEVLYNDELQFRVFRGTDGEVFLNRCNSSGTIREYPIVVDVDNDDHAEIVLMENSYAFRCEPITQGIHVFGHPENQWVRTRRIWNQHTYHVTNIDEDGNVPRNEMANWRVPGLNNFRQNVQPDGLFDAPDLVAVDLSVSLRGCGAELRPSVRVVNEGRASAPAGVPVTFYVGEGDARERIGRAATSRPLLPGESEVVEGPPYVIPDGRGAEVFVFSAEVNDPEDAPLTGVNECRVDNNGIAGAEAQCPIIG